MKKYVLLIISLFLTSCVGIPDNVTAIEGFDVNRYLGTWYEIARLDHRFERGLDNISANYSLRDDGGVNVLNKGWNTKDKEWSSAEGVGYFVDQPNIGRLKVSFFGPFYGGYNVIELDKQNYSYSVVTGPDKSYLWILSRTKQLPDTLQREIIGRLEKSGYATDKLIFVNHDR